MSIYPRLKQVKGLWQCEDHFVIVKGYPSPKAAYAAWLRLFNKFNPPFYAY